MTSGKLIYPVPCGSFAFLAHCDGSVDILVKPFLGSSQNTGKIVRQDEACQVLISEVGANVSGSAETSPNLMRFSTDPDDRLRFSPN